MTAEVGDDVLDRDPTTQALEERVAELLGKDRALFFPSGIQANQTALAVHGRPGTEGSNCTRCRLRMAYSRRS